MKNTDSFTLRGTRWPHVQKIRKALSCTSPLEPCCHYGKTPPCTEAIIAGGLSKVFIGSRDPNPLVSGKGSKMLQNAGIEVTTDFMKEECDALNPVFFHFIIHQTPYVVMKYAMTMDGKIATVTGASKWITGEKARENVHRDRHHYAAIMAGKGTIIKDDPLLTCRMNGGKHPIRIICDSQLTIPITAKVVTTTAEAPPSSLLPAGIGQTAALH